MYNLSMVHFNVMRYYIVNMEVKTRSKFPLPYFFTQVKCSPHGECINKDSQSFKITRKKTSNIYILMYLTCCQE